MVFDLSALWKGIECGLSLIMCNKEWKWAHSEEIINVHDAVEQGEDEDVMMHIDTHDGMV